VWDDEPMPDHPRGYDQIKALAQKLGTTIPGVLALARDNDPFFAGAPIHGVKAQWFRQLWTDFGYTTGVHLRRVHYQLVSQREPVLKPDKTPYLNTVNDWHMLNYAGKYARYLGLVDPEAFEDHRNPSAYISDTPWRTGLGLGVAWDEGFSAVEPWELPSIRADLATDLTFRLPVPDVTGYEDARHAQPYHLEVWIEKSTMDDVLAPLCHTYGAILQPGMGYQSITNIVQLLRQRVAYIGKPTRIFYVSDYDPAGDNMPVSVARQIEYWSSRYVPGADIKLTPLALTREQVAQYALPRTPVKETDRRKGNFEAIHGEGAVELDALEALHPGVLVLQRGFEMWCHAASEP
jgi:hypothetical protein